MPAAAQIGLEFCLCLALVGFTDPRPSRRCDIIADKTGLSGNWIGVVLLETVTPLVELATGASAVTVAAAPDIAVGDALGGTVGRLGDGGDHGRQSREPATGSASGLAHGVAVDYD